MAMANERPIYQVVKRVLWRRTYPERPDAGPGPMVSTTVVPESLLAYGRGHGRYPRLRRWGMVTARYGFPGQTNYPLGRRNVTLRSDVQACGGLRSVMESGSASGGELAEASLGRYWRADDHSGCALAMAASSARSRTSAGPVSSTLSQRGLIT